MYSHVFVAGTFDTLHEGHEAFLTHGFEVGDRVTIGLTSDEFIGKFKSAERKYVPFGERKKRLMAWLVGKDFENRVTVIPIDDPYEPAASMDGLDALLVTKDNISRGVEINKKRAARGLTELTLVEVPMTPGEDAKPISATRIANGEIDRAGRLIMPDALRQELARPLGEVLTGDAIGSSIERNRNGVVITVGDMTTKTILTAGVVPNLIIVDFHVARKPFADNESKLAELGLYRKQVVSGPGFIATEAVESIRKWARHPSEKMILAITGEEDLLALPAIAYGPEDAVVYYGQPPEAAWACGPNMRDGMVEVLITHEKRAEAIALLEKFSVK